MPPLFVVLFGADALFVPNLDPVMWDCNNYNMSFFFFFIEAVHFCCAGRWGFFAEGSEYGSQEQSCVVNYKFNFLGIVSSW